jgi:hypothetical protein
MSRTPRRPTSGNWTRRPNFRFPNGVVAEAYTHSSGARVLSAVEWVENEGGTTTEEWHVSVSFVPISLTPDFNAAAQIPDNLVMAMVRRDFGMDEGFEDNHQPGRVRNLWLAIDPKDRRPQCECVDNEKPHEQGPRLWREAPEDRP